MARGDCSERRQRRTSGGNVKTSECEQERANANGSVKLPPFKPPMQSDSDACLCIVIIKKKRIKDRKIITGWESATSD